jgi:glyoxylase-like metal-dependent hydrolase (beta-lactamase superfamily II)
MRVLRLEGSGQIYSSNVYLVRGDWNALTDVNTLVDVGQDPAVVRQIEAAATGVGKRKVEQVILTHSHSDHAGLLPAIRALYQPLVRAWSPALEGVERPLREGERLLMGDRFFEVWHVPAHSDDSVCLYCESEEVLFAGDTPLLVTGTENSFDDKFLKLLERLCLRPPRVIYFGHGEPVQDGCGARLRASLENVRHSLARQGGRP